jgi:radical SAM protein with 4Fe4S-binding SPASM domain
MTPRKVLNLAKLYLGFLASRVSGRPLKWGLPFSVSIEPTTSCNLRCPQCPSGLRSFTRPTGMLDLSLFENIVGQLRKELHSLTLYFQGEPFLHPHLTQMIALAGSKGVYTITSTNGHFLGEENARKTVESGLDKLIISIDGLTQETYSQYRTGGQLDKVIEGTKHIVAQKRALKSRTPHIVWQIVAFRSNEHELEEVKRIGRQIGVDQVKIKTAQIYDFAEGHRLMPENEKLSRYRKDPNGQYVIKNELSDHCWRMWQGCVITWDGKVVPCCFDKDGAYRLGDLSGEDFRAVWRSPAYDSFRRSVLNHRKEIDICSNCSEGTRIWV